MGESDEAGPPNLLEDDLRLAPAHTVAQEAAWREVLSDEELEPLAALEDDGYPVHDEVLVVVDRTAAAQALCRSPTPSNYVGVHEPFSARLG